MHAPIAEFEGLRDALIVDFISCESIMTNLERGHLYRELWTLCFEIGENER